jgi:hypothetical protein
MPVAFKLYTVSAAADEVGVSTATIGRAITDGQLEIVPVEAKGLLKPRLIESGELARWKKKFLARVDRRKKAFAPVAAEA